jgi:hypothetical protein
MTTIDASLSTAWNALTSLLENSTSSSSAVSTYGNENGIGVFSNSDNAFTDRITLSDGAKAFLAQQSFSITSAVSNNQSEGAYLQAQQAAHTQADGTVQGWSTSASDVYNVASSAQAIEPQLLSLAQAFPDSYPGLAQAIQNGKVTVTSAQNIPGLNFQNSFTFEGGEGGSGGSSEVSFNSSLPTFHNPNVQTVVMDNGTVVSWPTSATQQTNS